MRLGNLAVGMVRPLVRRRSVESGSGAVAKDCPLLRASPRISRSSLWKNVPALRAKFPRGLANMGISFAWTAVEALPPAEALSRLSLGATGQTCAFPFDAVASHVLPEQWFLVAAGRCNHRIIGPESMSELSKGCDAVACAIEEHVNFSMAELWRDGVRVWQVEYSAERTSDPLHWSGTLPDRFHTLHTAAEPDDSDKLDGIFLMDIPLIMAKEVAGYRHDEDDPGFDTTPFQLLTDLRPRKPWWKPWT